MPIIGNQAAHHTTHESGGSDEISLTGLTAPLHHATHEDGGSDEIDITGLPGGVGLDDTPVDGETAKGITSNWAYDHKADANAHHVPSVVFVDRGDPVGVDAGGGSFTVDGGWHDLDLSSVIPAGAIAIAFRLEASGNTVGMSWNFRKNGNTNVANISAFSTLVANVGFLQDGIVAVDANRIFEYMIGGGTPGYTNFYIRGWWIK